MSWIASKALPVWVLFINTSLVYAETLENTLVWSSDRCDEMGYGGQFDYCAVLEFCGQDEFEEFGRKLEEEEREDAAAYMTEDIKHVTNGDLMEEVMEEDMKEMGISFDDFDSFDEEMDGDDGDSFANLRKAEYGWRIPGSKECSYPGPTIRMERGKSYGLVVSNPVEETVTNLHTHGLHVAGHGNADDVTRKIGTGDSLVYNYTIPSHHMGGTFWYHSHAHPNTEKHVAGGAFGMLIVEDGEDVGTEDEGVLAFLKNERSLVLSNNGGGKYDYPWVGTTVPFDKDSILHIDANEWYRLRVLMVNVDPNRDSEKITFDGCEVHPIAHDGVLRFEVPAEGRKNYFLSLSSRVDLAVRCGDGPSTGIRLDGQRIAMLKSTGKEGNHDISPFVDGGSTWSSKRPPYLADLRNATPDHKWGIKMGEVDINDQTYNVQQPLCDKHGRNFRFGNVEEWTVRTDSHPLHVHGHHMQVVDEFCGDGHDSGEYYDTLFSDGPCKVRMHLLDVAGRTTLHCHVYRHGDGGSMGFINIVDGPVQPDEPRVHSCKSGETCDEPIKPLLCEGNDNEDEDGREDESVDFLDDYF